jgi:hypothetical protein
VVRSNQSLNRRKNGLVVSCGVCLSSRAQSAGVSVRATMPDSTTAITRVTANCRSIVPVMPPRNAAGMNTAQSANTMATSAPATWPIALFAAALGGSFSSSMRRSTFSITTMASSTTMPMASTRAKRVSRFTEYPRAERPRKVPMMLTGTARIGISVARQVWRKRKTTRVTRAIASRSVITTSSMEAVTNGVVSNGMVQETPGGKAWASSFIRAVKASFTWSWFAPGRR